MSYQGVTLSVSPQGDGGQLNKRAGIFKMTQPVEGASGKPDRAGRASPEPASSLGHSATIPSAVHVAAAKVICRSGRFETGQGTCSLLCMEFLGDPRKNGCPHALKIHGSLALTVLECGK